MAATAHAFNPRYVQYALAHQKTPEAMLEDDRERWPGGIMAGFITWHGERLGEARKAIPQAFTCGGLIDHAAYDAWLEDRVFVLLDDKRQIAEQMGGE